MNTDLVYCVQAKSGVHYTRPTADSIHYPGAVYQLIQVGGLNSGRPFYMDCTNNTSTTRAEHRNLENIYTYGYIQALQKRDLDFRVSIITKQIKLSKCLELLYDLLRMGKDAGAHLTNFAHIQRIYLDAQQL